MRPTRHRARRAWGPGRGAIAVTMGYLPQPRRVQLAAVRRSMIWILCWVATAAVIHHHHHLPQQQKQQQQLLRAE